MSLFNRIARPRYHLIRRPCMEVDSKSLNMLLISQRLMNNWINQIEKILTPFLRNQIIHEEDLINYKQCSLLADTLSISISIYNTYLDEVNNASTEEQLLILISQESEEVVKRMLNNHKKKSRSISLVTIDSINKSDKQKFKKLIKDDLIRVDKIKKILNLWFDEIRKESNQLPKEQVDNSYSKYLEALTNLMSLLTVIYARHLDRLNSYIDKDGRIRNIEEYFNFIDEADSFSLIESILDEIIKEDAEAA